MGLDRLVQHTGRVHPLEIVARLSGHDDDTHVPEQTLGVHFAVDVRAVQARKSQIENDGGRCVDFQKPQCLGAICHSDHRETVTAEDRAIQLPRARIIFNDEHE